MKRQFWDLTDEDLAKYPYKKLNIAYGHDSKAQILDLYWPEDPGNTENKPFPVIFHTHGGAFANGGQRENNLLPMLEGLKRGYCVASLQYRTSREALFPAQLYDAKLALRFLRAHAEEFHIDSSKIAAWGPSSGGWLASMLGVTAKNPAFEDLTMGYADWDSSVCAVIDWCGPCGGFLNMDPALIASGTGKADHNEADSPESRFLGNALPKIPELVHLACPCTYADKNIPPVYILHGSADGVVPVEQSIIFRDAIASAAGDDKVKLHIVKDKPHHGDPWFYESWVSDEALDFLDQVMKQ